MSPEKHLAAILAAFSSSQNLGMDSELYEALMAAEKDFDGVEEMVLPVLLTDGYVLEEDFPKLGRAFSDQTGMLEHNRRVIDEEINNPENVIRRRTFKPLEAQ